MKNPTLIKGTLVKRYQRFLVNIRLENGKTITAACPNTGSMKSCSEPGSPVLMSRDDNPNRKFPFTWEMTQVNNVWVGINTSVPNKLIHRAVKKGQIPELTGYSNIQTEVKYGENSRIDLLLSNGEKRCYVEIKSVTLVEDKIAYFPDAVSTRGQKHLAELKNVVEQGHRAVLLFLVQRNDAEFFKPETAIDPDFAAGLKDASEHGVEILVYLANVSIEEITLGKSIPFALE
ncbi:MAG: DNA/RNA nuclease SfsA [Calditrichaeota bacterium]|nr:MAG: DNA/RNA nuclease SfsA [Calditrichota bacterium]